jgi:hypothetical protein
MKKESVRTKEEKKRMWKRYVNCDRTTSEKNKTIFMRKKRFIMQSLIEMICSFEFASKWFPRNAFSPLINSRMDQFFLEKKVKILIFAHLTFIFTIWSLSGILVKTMVILC